MLVTSLFLSGWIAAAAFGGQARDVSCGTRGVEWQDRRAAMTDAQKHEFIARLVQIGCSDLAREVQATIRPFDPGPVTPARPREVASAPRSGPPLAKSAPATKSPAPPPKATPKASPKPDRYAFCDVYDATGPVTAGYTDLYVVKGDWSAAAEEARFAERIKDIDVFAGLARRCRAFADAEIAEEYLVAIAEEQSPRAHPAPFALAGVQDFEPRGFLQKHSLDARFKAFSKDNYRLGYCSVTVHGSNGGRIVTNLVVTKAFAQPPYTGSYVTRRWTDFIAGLKFWDARGECRVAKTPADIQAIFDNEVKASSGLHLVPVKWLPWASEDAEATRKALTREDFLAVPPRR